MPVFHSYYWTGVDVDGSLASLLDSLRDPGAGQDAVVSRLRGLLLSDNTAVRCMALDWFSLQRSQSRHGGSAETALYPAEPEVRSAALCELAAPPFEGPGAVRGANHGSALTALGYVADPSDADIVGRALMANDDPAVLAAGILTATAMTHRTPVLPPVLAQALERIVNDPGLPMRTRVDALETAALSRDAAVTSWLLVALESADVTMSASAGRQLLRRGQGAHRERVRAVAATWPSGTDVPWEVVETRQMLDDD
jgi:hypothetical protein